MKVPVLLVGKLLLNKIVIFGVILAPYLPFSDNANLELNPL